MKCITLIVSLLFMINALYSQTNDTEIDLLDPAGKMLIGFSLLAGKGIEDNYVGTAYKYNEFGSLIRTEDVKMGGGGGQGVGLLFSYNIFSRVEILSQYTYLNRGLTPDPDDAEGDFRRHILQATGFLRLIKFGESTYVKVGGGMGIYFPGEYVVDLSESGGARVVHKFDASQGIHYAIECEVWELGGVARLGIQKYEVDYRLKNSSEKLNGDGFAAYFGAGFIF